MRVLRTLLLGFGLAVCTAAQAEPAVYFVEHSVRAPGHSGTMRSFGYNQVTLEHGPAGALRMETRPLWSQQRGGGGSRRSTDDLDPDDPADAATIDVLKSGFEMRVSADGTPGPLQAVDADAWARLTALRPRAAQMLTADAPQTLGLQARALPPRLQVGQIIRQHVTSPALGRIDTRLEVLTLDDTVAVMAMQLEGDTLRGSGRQAVRLADGMPLDVRLGLDMDATDDMPAIEQHLRMVAIETGPLLDLSGSNATVAEYQAEVLAAPPFSEHSDDPTLYEADPPPRGVLLPDMLDADQVDARAPQLEFALEPRSMGRARLGMRAGRSDADEVAPQDLTLLIAELRSVTLRDADGRALPGLDPVITQPRIIVFRDWHSDEGEADFPFRLPPGTRDAALETLATIEFDVELETFVWDGVETVAAGSQPQSQTGARVDWMSPSRIAFEQPRAWPGQTTALWSLPVPIDAEGRELPVAVQVRVAPDDADALDWERRHGPQRTEIATPAPIAAVELRRYRWTLVPRTWTFERRDSVD